MSYDYTKKPNFEELEKNNNLERYVFCLEDDIILLEIDIDRYNIRVQDEITDNISQYKNLLFYKQVETYKQKLKVLKERKKETNEYLEEVIKKMRENLKL